TALASACERSLIAAVLAVLAAIAAAALALGCRESTVMRGQSRAARSDVTWAMCNARRLGPCERSEQGPRRRALRIAPRCTAQGGEVWLHLGDCQRPSPRALRAERARSEAAGVGGRPSEARVSRRSSYRICLAVQGTKRRGLASLDLPRTSADEGLASGASEARGGGRS
ncbi:hypothetical protein TYRP_016117, partial [Tyrophagus putrescentiae]